MSATVVSEEVLVTFPCTSAKALSINSDSCGDSCIDASEEEDEAPLDQRHLNLVHEELEKLNIATDVINKLELQLDEARARFSEIQSSWSEKLRELSKKYGSAIGKARPFYEAKYQERKLRDELQRAALRFERAHSMQQVAKQQVNLTQESLNRQSTVHPECLEVLNHHISRVNEAEKERVEAEEAHKVVSTKLLSLAREISKMEKDQKSAIKKSYQYFEKRKEFTLVLEQQKDLIQRLEAEVRQKKCDYTTSMGNLERISDSIHEQRSLNGQSRARIAKEAPANPPPYMPTAPPPYEQLTGSGASRANDAFSNREALKFIIGNDPEDEIIEPVLTMLEGDIHWNKERPKNLGSGVILLAQQLMGGEPEPQHENYILSSRSSQSDVRYQTCLPEGIPANTPETPSSDTSSLASARASLNLTDEENLAGMLRSHSQLIQEIDGCANRVEMLLRRSVSDTERESGTESSNGAF